MKNSTLISALAVTAAMLVNGCSGGAKKGAGGSGAPVLVAQAVDTNVPVLINPPPVGHVMAYSTVTIRSQIGGVIRPRRVQRRLRWPRCSAVGIREN